MKRLTNQKNLPLSIALWLGTDNYDYNDDPYTISATTFNKPLRAVLLAMQNAELLQVEDVSSLIPSSMGTAIHDSIERAWTNTENVSNMLQVLGFPRKLIERIRINPSETDVTDGDIPIYMEKRLSRKLGKWTITGKFDFLAEGNLEDFKSTSVYAYINGSNIPDYIRQGSIYRWLDPELITGDTIKINYIFTDWSAAMKRQSKNYPESKIVQKQYQLMSLVETETMLRDILYKIENLRTADQSQLPVCTPEELWKSPDVYKYYKNPENKKRSTKNFDSRSEAMARHHEDGYVGEIVTVPGEVKRCKYCEVLELCDQAQLMIEQGQIKIEL